MKHLIFNTARSFPFLISITVLLCAVMVLIEGNSDYTDSDRLFQKIICGISVIASIVTFIIMWKSRSYDQEVK